MAYLAGDLAALSARAGGGPARGAAALRRGGLIWQFRLHAAGVDAIGRLGLELPATTAGRWPS